MENELRWKAMVMIKTTAKTKKQNKKQKQKVPSSPESQKKYHTT